MREKNNSKLLETSFLYYTSLIIGSCIVIFGMLIGEHPYGQLPSDAYVRVVLLLGFPWIIITSLVVIVRREIPRPWNSSIKGAYAVFQGAVGLVVSGGVVIYLLFTLLQEIFRKLF